MWKEYEYTVTVLTPTYNRQYTLTKLFNSLRTQKNQRFQWLIIDDGSTDGTEEYIKNLPKTEFVLEYYKKENGGKHTALNYAHPFIKGELTVIVDSDDYLLPDAVETIEKEWALYRENKNLCGMSYFKGLKDGTHLSKDAPTDFYVNDDISYRVNHNITGDRCEVVRTDLLKEHPFPIYEGERFFSEGWFWTTLAMNYKTVYRNKTIYICEYLDDGLSKSGRKLRLQSPHGMMESCKVYLTPRVKLTRRIKSTWLYICYGICARHSIQDIITLSGQKTVTALNIPAGITLYLYWKKST